MFCANPECPDFQASGVPGEYRAGITACPVCGSGLVERDPRQRAAIADDDLADLAAPQLVEAVAETSDPAEIDIVRSILDGAEIPYVVEGSDAHAAYRAGHALHRFEPLFGALRFLVPSELAEEARALLTAVDDDPDGAAAIEPE